MATSKNIPIKNWYTIHQNGPYTSKRIIQTKLKEKKKERSSFKRYNLATAEIQKIIKKCHEKGEGFRALGSRWSLSNIAHHPENMHDNTWMKLRFSPNPSDIHHESPYDHSNIFLFQCGNTIKQISEYLESKWKSLKTHGASNGQTIAGCISTGVHGSALDIGSVQDYVVGLQLIIGPYPKDVIYLERHTKPVLTESYISNFNARIIRNDALFEAALVGLGSFGFIHGVVLESVDLFLLKRYIKKIDRDRALQMASTMDFSGTADILPKEVDQNGKGLRPYHYKLFINQYNEEEKIVAEFIYKKPYRDNYPFPLPIIKKAVYTDLIRVVKYLLERFPGTIPFFVNQLSKQSGKIMPRVDKQTTGTLKETFWDAGATGPAFASSVGIDIADAPKALRVLSDMTKANPIPGIYAMRFVKQSKALLACTQFPITCMLEIDGVLWRDTETNTSLQKYNTLMVDSLEAEGIKYTIHWGKNAQWNRPGLLNTMYGTKSQEWMELRSSLLTKAMCKLFSNPFVKTIGLHKHLSGVSKDLIASLDTEGKAIA